MQKLKILRLKEEMFISSESISLEAKSFIEEIDKIIASETDILKRAIWEGMREGVEMLAKHVDERSYEAYVNSEMEIMGCGDGSAKLLNLKADRDSI